MKTDRDLLELAAKAAGYSIYRWGTSASSGLDFAYISGGIPWQPLTDDGDAFRLAVALRLSPRYYGGFIEICGHDIDGAHLLLDHKLPALHNMFVETRRAIVRAAAKLGESS